MTDEKNYLIRAATWLARRVGQIAPRFDDFTTNDLGIDLPDAVLLAPAVTDAAQRARVAAIKVEEGGVRLESAAVAGDEVRILTGLLELGTGLSDLYTALAALAGAAASNVSAATISDPVARARAAEFAGELAKRIADHAIASGITEFAPRLAYVLKLAGLLEWTNVPRVSGNETTRAHIRRVVRLDGLKSLFQDPAAHLQQSIGWGDPGFDPSDFFRLIYDFHPYESAIQLGFDGGDPFLHTFVTIRRDRSVQPPGLSLSLEADYTNDRSGRVALNDEWGIGAASTLRVSGAVTGLITPPLEFDLKPLSGEFTGGLRAFVDRNAEARPFDIVAGTGLLSLAAENLSAGVEVDAGWNGTTSRFEPRLFVDLTGLVLQIGTDDADSFIGSLLAAADIQGRFDLGLEWQASTGLRVKASGGAEISIPVHRQLGPVELQTIYVMLLFQNDGTLALELSAALSGSLGPLSASVDRIGTKLDLRFASGTDARFGSFDVALRFKAPNGIGLAIDAGIVRGGGYLGIDPERGEYSGMLELEFSGFLTLKAIGIVTTRMPDGSNGFSLIVIITAEFGSGIQLGFGFTLIGVGGLLGLHRTACIQPLAEGVRTGAVESVMFPRDIVANAPRILSDLRSFFPPQQGIFLIGPMAKLGWGTPTLLTASLGIIAEIPGNILVLGVLRVVLPDEEAAILKLQVNFIGVIEFDKKRIWFFAALFDSRVVFLTIEGEMGLLMAFGEDSDFVLSVGGFHPSFSPPALPFPSPRRIVATLIDTELARVRVEGYFAVTPNTVQFGAAAEIFFGLSELGVHGHLSFDALFQFSPFHFVVAISASFDVEVFGLGMFGVRIQGTLEGPTPWRAYGTGSISLLFFDVDVDFDVTWGEADHSVFPAIEVMPRFKAEIEKQESWQAVIPSESNVLVTLRKLEADDGLVLHPIGVLRIAQRALPLDITLGKVGNQKPSDVNALRMKVTGGGLAWRADAWEKFAPAQFQEFSDSEKLSRPAFAPEHAGIELSAEGANLSSSRMVRHVVRYEEIIIDSNAQRHASRFARYIVSLFTFFLGGGAVTACELSRARKKKLVPFDDRIEVRTETFVVAYQANNRVYSDSHASFASEASAREYLRREVAKNPSAADEIHVIPEFEKAA